MWGRGCAWYKRWSPLGAQGCMWCQRMSLSARGFVGPLLNIPGCSMGKQKRWGPSAPSSIHVALGAGCSQFSLPLDPSSGPIRCQKSQPDSCTASPSCRTVSLFSAWPRPRVLTWSQVSHGASLPLTSWPHVCGGGTVGPTGCSAEGASPALLCCSCCPKCPLLRKA